MFSGLKDVFSPFSAISPHSHIIPLLKKIELGEKLHIDIHSHIIPGVDDGVKSNDESMILIDKFVQLGYKKIITTPHMMQDRYNNTHQKIQDGLAEIRREILKQSIKIEIDAAAEYYIDEQFINLLYKRELLTFSDNYILFEMSAFHMPINLFDLVLEMQIAGYKPVLAHPERYCFMHDKRNIYKSLKEQGVLFQVDMLSFTNYHSSDVQRTALWLCNSGMIDFLGSDAHKIEHLNMIEKLKSASILKSVYEKNKLLNSNL